MHYSLLLISNKGTYKRTIKQLMRPFEEVFARKRNDDRLDTRNEESGLWRNSKAEWDWYEIGGRYRGRIPAARGTKTKRDEYFMRYDWYMKYDRRGCYDYAKVSDIRTDVIDPNDWFCVLLPDGTWHTQERYELNGKAINTIRNPEWDDFVANFIEPYMDCDAVCIDCHC